MTNTNTINNKIHFIIIDENEFNESVDSDQELYTMLLEEELTYAMEQYYKYFSSKYQDNNIISVYINETWYFLIQDENKIYTLIDNEDKTDIDLRILQYILQKHIRTPFYSFVDDNVSDNNIPYMLFKIQDDENNYITGNFFKINYPNSIYTYLETFKI